MSDISNEFHTRALEYAIKLINDLVLGEIPQENKTALKANLANKLYLAISRGQEVTAEDVKKIINNIAKNKPS